MTNAAITKTITTDHSVASGAAKRNRGWPVYLGSALLVAIVFVAGRRSLRGRSSRGAVEPNSE